MGLLGEFIAAALTRTGSGATGINPITIFRNALGRYPGNNKQWWVAKRAGDDPEDKSKKEGDFLPEILDKMFSGNTKAPRGHFLLNAFRKNRSNASGVAGLKIEDPGRRAVSTTFFSGRVWWAGLSEVYYSQIIDTRVKAGFCYQEADPTSEDISDLIASDGGVIPLPEARDICRIVAMGSGVMVFAANGLWFITGGNGGFSATDVSISKVSSVGTQNPLAIVSVAETVYWWSEIGIHALEQAMGQFGPIPGKFGNTNIAEETIQTFYNEIPEESKRHAKALYDPKNNLIQWLYSDPFDSGTYNKVLNFDVTLGAFYPWQLSPITNGPRVIGSVVDTGVISTEIQEDVTTTTGQPVTKISLDNIQTSVYNTTVDARPSNINYITKVNNSVTFSKIDNPAYVDWETFDGNGVPYLSYVTTGYELLEDTMRKKEAFRVFIHFRRTEDDGLDGVPSSCKFRTMWDWSANSNSNKWTREVEAYRPRQPRIATTADIGEGFPVVTSNNKVRGSGKAVQFRFESDEPGKNFDLLGWSVAYVGNTEP